MPTNAETPDNNCVNTFIQYNYSHDNLRFCGIMKKPGRNHVIRHNISENDRTGIYFYGFDRERSVEKVHIHNHTHYVRKGLDVSVFVEGRGPLNTTFENNIFHFEGKGEWGRNGKGINTVFRNNLYHSIEPHSSETRPIQADPGFVPAGRTGRGIDLKTMAALRGYQPKTGSPCINAGIPIKDHGDVDILKTAIESVQTDIGVVRADPTLRSKD